jgi:predicted flap endonuclease-1-like 5' DNA nuclease
MAWSQEFLGARAVGEGAERALRVPVGMISPFWAMYAAAAGVGVAYWWMTGWTRVVNVEASGPFEFLRETEPVVIAAEPVPVAEPAEASLAALAPVVIAETALAAMPVPETVAEVGTVAEVVVGPAKIADDLTRLSGIGPKLAAALAERGVNRFAQLAAWTAEDLARFDAELSLKGRAVREAWVAQARRLAAS